MGQYVKAGSQYDVGLYSLGEAILKNSFREASSIFLHGITSLAQAWEIQQSLAFINGSGLETTIGIFALSYDPERLRETFFRQGRRVQQLASSSATTAGV